MAAYFLFSLQPLTCDDGDDGGGGGEEDGGEEGQTRVDEPSTKTTQRTERSLFTGTESELPASVTVEETGCVRGCFPIHV